MSHMWGGQFVLENARQMDKGSVDISFLNQATFSELSIDWF